MLARSERGPGADQRIWTPTEVNRRCKHVLEHDADLRSLWVRGEIHQTKVSSAGHAYFNLKDSESVLPCVAFRDTAVTIPTDGTEVFLHGRIGTYLAGGRYQLVVDALLPAGTGNLWLRYLALKAKLEKEGLFAPDAKRPLPRHPSLIGVVTSASGAAVRDVLKVTGRRAPWIDVIVSPTPVQGDAAPLGIERALALAARAGAEVVILTRGGGSLEDLWSFNEESVVRAVRACPVPVIAAIGHETDVTLAELAADARAPTPSAAAERATPDGDHLRELIQGLRDRLIGVTERRIESMEEGLGLVRYALSPRTARDWIDQRSLRIDGLSETLRRLTRHRLDAEARVLEGRARALEALSPYAVLGRGYAVVESGGRVVRDAASLAPGDELTIRLMRGEADARVERTRMTGPGGRGQ